MRHQSIWPYWPHDLLHILVTKVICRDVEVTSTKVTCWQLSKQTTASKRYRFIGLKIFKNLTTRTKSAFGWGIYRICDLSAFMLNVFNSVEVFTCFGLLKPNIQ